MLERYVRPLYQRFCVDRLARAVFVSPIWITLLGCFLGVLAAIFVGFQFPIIGLFFLLLSGYCDTLDGSVARQQAKVSAAGSVLDILCDRVVEAAILIALWAIAPNARSLLVLLMMASILLCITSFLVVGIFTENHSNKSFHYSSGLIERGEAFLFFTLMILFPPLFPLLAWLFFILVMLTSTIRVYQFLLGIQ